MKKLQLSQVLTGLDALVHRTEPPPSWRTWAELDRVRPVLREWTLAEHRANRTARRK
jgi:hypothetical protein